MCASIGSVTTDLDPADARTLWHRLETLNAVVYFSPEGRDIPDRTGLRGFWMGYFAARAAPLGPVGPGVVEATFYNFHPERVRRAVPEAWAFALPSQVIEAREAAVAAALRRHLPDGEVDALAAAVLPPLREVIEQADGAGRPLFAANRDLPVPSDPAAALWQAATTLREQRGDAHVALLVEAGLDGCEAHVLAGPFTGVTAERVELSRGWPVGDWETAAERLRERKLLTDVGDWTGAGRELHDRIEARTDELAARPYQVLGEDRVRELVDRLSPAAAQVAASGEISYPNPMGLPSVAE